MESLYAYQANFFDDSKVEPLPDPISYAAKLKSVMTQLQPTPVRQQQKGNSYVSPHLKSCTHVFVRHDAVKKPLQKPYDGPFKVIKHSTKHFTLEINGSNDVVSVDCLKPAFYELSPESTQPTLTDSTSQQQTALPTKLTRVTRSGRHVRWSKHLCSIFTNNLEGEYYSRSCD